MSEPTRVGEEGLAPRHALIEYSPNGAFPQVNGKIIETIGIKEGVGSAHP